MTATQQSFDRLHARFVATRAGGIVDETVRRATAVRVPRMAAALVFYLLLSIAPLLVVVVGVAGLVVGQQANEVYDQILEGMGEVVGVRAAEFIAATVTAQAERITEGLLTTAAGVFILLWSASRGFNEFQDALDTVWEVAPPDGIRPGVLRTIRQRALSFLLTIAGGVALTLYVLVRPTINAFSNSIDPHLPQAVDFANALNAVFAFLLIAAVLATLYRFLPNTAIRWSDVWLASLLVALVLTVGQVVFTVYLDFARQLGFLGAASSPLVVLALTHTAVQAVYFGALFSRTYAHRFGSKVEAVLEASLDSQGLA